MTPSDRKSMQKYLDISHQFIDKTITVGEFENTFLELRRNDNYWMGGRFDTEISKIIDTLFLDVDEYTPEHLYDDTAFNITEAELYKRVKEAVRKLENLL